MNSSKKLICAFLFNDKFSRAKEVSMKSLDVCKHYCLFYCSLNCKCIRIFVMLSFAKICLRPIMIPHLIDKGPYVEDIDSKLYNT